MNSNIQNQPDLAAAFGDISAALDRVPDGREHVFLAKMLLDLCRDIDITRVRESIAIGLQDIEFSPQQDAGKGPVK